MLAIRKDLFLLLLVENRGRPDGYLIEFRKALTRDLELRVPLVGHEHRRGRLLGRWDLTYTGENSTTALDIPAFRMPERLIHDAYVGTSIGEQWRVGLDVRNVYFGHTHRSLSGEEHRGVRFHNCGAPIRGHEFQIITADLS